MWASNQILLSYIRDGYRYIHSCLIYSFISLISHIHSTLLAVVWDIFARFFGRELHRSNFQLNDKFFNNKNKIFFEAISWLRILYSVQSNQCIDYHLFFLKDFIHKLHLHKKHRFISCLLGGQPLINLLWIRFCKEEL